MLPLPHRIAFLVFAFIACALGARGFLRLYRRIHAGRADTEPRWNQPAKRLAYALRTTLLQTRTFRKRLWISFAHSFIFYGFVFYLLVNLVDAVDGYIPLSFRGLGVAGQVYVFVADLLSALVLVAMVALVLRRFVLPSRRDFRFNERTLLHPDVRTGYITRDSLIVSAFILFHVGSRAIGAGAKLAIEGPDRFAPFASLLSHLFTPGNAEPWRIFGYWGALGSVLAFLSYFPYSKHIHIFAAPAKYLVARDVNSGTLPSMELQVEEAQADGSEMGPALGASKLEQLAWPRLLDAYACIQCNRCQDVCPATATGKSLSPSALEINKRMELNRLSHEQPRFEHGDPSPHPLLSFALTPEALWACTTCGACMEACPVQDEPMLDIIDIRRHQVMTEGQFPAPLQAAFRGMERASNPWGISHDKRLDWAAGLGVRTTDEHPEPDVLYWVGCAASYDPQAQKTARAFVQLLQHAGVDFAVLGKRECCTGDTARRAGNEYLFRQLADTNIATLNTVRPKLIVATCPHCLNTVGHEYRQLGGEYKVMHHTEYLASLVAEGRLTAASSSDKIAFHDPCYLGRHNGVYEAPRNVLRVLSNSLVELDRNRENSFCCGAGGAQFWKEEEPGSQRISENRYEEAQAALSGEAKGVLAVGCPFCKSMLNSTPGKSGDGLAIHDIAELLLEGVQRQRGTTMEQTAATELSQAPAMIALRVAEPIPRTPPAVATEAPADQVTEARLVETPGQAPRSRTDQPVLRKKWIPKPATPAAAAFSASPTGESKVSEPMAEIVTEPPVTTPQLANPDAPIAATSDETGPSGRKKWTPRSRSAKT